MSTVGRNRDSEDHSDEISEGNEEHVTKQWRKGDPCDKVVKDFVDIVGMFFPVGTSRSFYPAPPPIPYWSNFLQKQQLEAFPVKTRLNNHSC